MSLSELEQCIAQQAAMHPNGPNGLGRPTHVVLDLANGMHVVWRCDVNGRPIHPDTPASAATLARVGTWNMRTGLLQPQHGYGTRLLVGNLSASFHVVVELAELWRKVQDERDQLDGGISNHYEGTLDGFLVQARNVGSLIDAKRAPGRTRGEWLLPEQSAVLSSLRPVIDAMRASDAAGRIVLLVPVTWPAITEWEDYPVIRTALPDPMVACQPRTVDAPDHLG